MGRKSGGYRRKSSFRPYRQRFVIAAEGARTERDYFSLFDQINKTVTVQWLPGRDKSAPSRVLQRIKDHLRQRPGKVTDEAWIVVDKDNWSDEQLHTLDAWTKEGPGNRGLAVSNPCFEYWLLLHFENGKGGATKGQCLVRLRKHLPGYDKRVKVGQFDQGMVYRGKIRMDS